MFSIKKWSFAIATLLFVGLPTALFAAPSTEQGIGIPGPDQATGIELHEMRVTYRFDQMGSLGKQKNTVPVQTTYKLHNPGSTQSFTLGIPAQYADGRPAEITAVYVNGKETATSIQSAFRAQNTNQTIRAATLTLTIAQDSDAIIDIRLNQPADATEFPFLMHTGAGWDGTVKSGTMEAIFAYPPANWNVALKKITRDEALPLTFSEQTAAWSFNDLPISGDENVYWHIADVETMEFYNKGNDRWQKTRGDEKSYTLMRDAMLDMIPCNGKSMPLASWWQNMYDTVTLGIITASTPDDGPERDVKALELWSNGWYVPSGPNAECILMRQRPERYTAALENLLAIPAEARNADVNNALKQHQTFLNNLSKQMGDGSLANQQWSVDQIPAVSNPDRSILAAWDPRFAPSPDVKGATTTPDTDSASNRTSTISGVVDNIKSWFPNLSRWGQIILFGLLALLVIIIIAFIILRWNEEPANYRPTSTPPQSGMGSSSKSPSFINPSKPLQEPTFPSLAVKEDKPVNAPIVKPTTPPSQTQVNAKINKPEVKLDEAYTDQKKPSYDPPWLQKKTQEPLIRPAAPPPSGLATNSLPWQQKNNQTNESKSSNQPPPKPTVKI